MPHKKTVGKTAGPPKSLSRWRRFYGSVWLFPCVLFVIVVLLAACQISGTSVGQYYPLLYGANQKDPALLVGHPQPIRSDEWLVVTQLTIAQNAAGYPKDNPNITGGKDMSVYGDAPYKDWSAAFRPQNLAFFALPLDYAFAFKWWLLLAITITACYFLVLRFFPAKRLLAALLATGFGLSPFFFWWYQTATFAPVFYGLFILLLGMRIINDEKVRFLEQHPLSYSQLIYAGGLAYLLTAFGLILYPPFQIPVALAVAAFLAGSVLDKHGLGSRLWSKASLKQLGTFAAGLLIAGTFILAFVHTNSQAVHDLTHTVYPGTRQIEGGGTPAFKIFSTELQPQLERTLRGIHYYDNQSEASNFLLLLPFLLAPGFLLLYADYRQTRKCSWTLLFVQLVAGLFLANLFLAGPQFLYRVLFLDKVPHERLFIGLGFVGVLQLLLVMKSLSNLAIRKRRLDIWAGVYSLLCLGGLLWTGDYVRVHWPLFIHSLPLVAALATVFAAILFCFLSRRFIIAVLLFAIFSFGCVFRVHPLYRGLGPLYPSKLTAAIDNISRPGDSWLALDSIFYENAALMANRPSLSGVQPYPNLKLWRQLEGKKDDYIYNRYAHAVFTTDSSLGSPVKLVQFDNFQVRFDCNSFITRNVQYVVVQHALNTPCTRPVGEVRYPAATFYLYHVAP